ncbi:MAG: BrnT family toxin [Elusimicrobia bacterium]|nr:BrnT family toxin [Elusimicrobiota bacterium]
MSEMRVLTVCHCFRESDSIIRIISARRATRKEIERYEEGER